MSLVAAVVSNDVAAEWINIGTGDGGRVTVYVETNFKRGDPKFIVMRSIYDFKSPRSDSRVSNQPYLSQRNTYGYDCQNSRTKSLYFSWHSGQMGGGNRINLTVDGRVGVWRNVEAGTLSERLWNFACGR